MDDVEIKFTREDLEGIVPIGTYLGDAMRRLGVPAGEPCDAATDSHDCVVTVTKGAELLSPLTSLETTYFEPDGPKDGERLACQTKIERPGEIEVMTKEKTTTEEPAKEAESNEYRKQFTELPLEKKIADLMRLEAITLGETFSFILNSPFKVFEKVGDVMAEFGMKLERDAKQSRRPSEHVETGDQNGADKDAEETSEKKPEAEQQG
ncbi:MAG TPA: hypothetical protein VGJ02_01250 [Pyrinomonadaceae bacterium]|jgi:ferredoxin